MENKTDQKQEINPTIVYKFPLWQLWTAGWLFTLGVNGAGLSFELINFLPVNERFLAVLISWLLWPLFLGFHFAK